MNEIFRKREKRIITLIVIMFCITPFFFTNNITMANSTDNTRNDDLMANAKDPMDSTVIDEIGFLDENYDQIIDVVINGTKTYLVLGDRGFAVLDTTDKSNPVVLTHFEDYICTALCVEDNYLYGTNNTGFYILDVSDFENINLYGNVTFAATFYDINVLGDYVYLTSQSGFYCYNITDLSNPIIEDFYINANLRETRIYSGIAYVVDSNIIRLFNITDRNLITYMYGISYSDTEDIFKDGNTLYISTETDVYSYNVTDLTGPPVELDSYKLNETGPNQIVVYNDKILVSYNDRIELIDATNISNLLYHSQQLTKSEEVDGIELINNYLFIYGDVAIEIVDISDIGNFVSLDYDQYFGISFDVSIEDNYAYIANYETMQIIDIRDSTNPVLVSKFYNEDIHSFRIFVKGDYAYILEEGFGLYIIDVSNPNDPILKGNISIAGTYQDLFVTEEYAYVALGGNGLAIIDIYYPDYPQMLMVYDEIINIYDIGVVDDNLFIAADSHFHIVDVSNPYVPEKISNWTRLDAEYRKMSLTDDYAIMTSWEGFDIIDISDIAKPVKVGQYFTYGDVYEIKADGQFIYMMDLTDGLIVFDATKIAHPKLIGTYDDYTSTVFNLAVRDGVIYFANSYNGLRILGTTPLLKVPFLTPIGVFLSIMLLSLGIAFYRKKKR